MVEEATVMGKMTHGIKDQPSLLSYNFDSPFNVNCLEHFIAYLLHHIYFGPNFIHSNIHYLDPVSVNYGVAYFMFGPSILNISFSPIFQFHFLSLAHLYCSGEGGTITSSEPSASPLVWAFKMCK